MCPSLTGEAECCRMHSVTRFVLKEAERGTDP